MLVSAALIRVRRDELPANLTLQDAAGARQLIVRGRTPIGGGREMEMFVAAAVLSGLLAFVFGAGAVGKLTKMRSEIDKATKLKIAWPRYRLIAAPEAAAAAGLLAGLGIAPLGVAAAVGLVTLMAGALAFRVRVHDAMPFLLGDAAVLVLAGVTATLRAVTA
jgi:DoxX-like family